MPPRYAYWTILVDEQPTAFRAADANDLQPTFKRLKEKHPSARMVWFQNGKIWASRLEAQESMRVRGERGRQGDFRQGQSERVAGKLEWKPKGTGPAEGWSRRSADRPPEPGGRRWEREGGKPKGTFAPAEKSERPSRAPRREDDRRPPRPRGERPEWRPKGSFKPDRAAGSARTFKPREDRGRRPDWKARTEDARPRSSGKLEWRPKSQGTGDARPEKRKWVPKEEFKKSPGSKPQARDKNWRPGGEHRDPRQKYKDAKKAKWTRFKKQIRGRWEAKQGKKRDK